MDIFNSLIHHWYSLYKRDLPWRDTRNPYFIWLSEIILQQTRIDQGMAYYMSFTEEFPTISDLASASEDKVLKLWQGLGYYSRARNLHYTAKYIVAHFNGKFPDEYGLILSLKGIGEYTAAAIASISFNQEYPAVDGNVYRVLSRFYGISDPIDTSAGKKIFVKLAAELIKGTDPGMHNQALMEFGALQCTPQKPDCLRCPLHEGCYAFANKKVADLPVKLKKTTQRHRYFNYFDISHGDSVWLKKRVGKDIWKNLFEFPMIETSVATGFEELMAMLEVNQLMDADNTVVEKIEDWKIHLLTHQKINYRIIKVSLLQEKEMPVELIRVNKKDIFNFAVPKLLETYLIRKNENG
ncbi:MAG: A/G-specific adenine glycosylase [Prolixibacteraceae bacterium]|nr:A/G-specific adenine glycosylase [Prolixibacteraceae bacterium]